MKGLLWRAVVALGGRPLSVGLMASLLLYLVMLLGFTFTSPPNVVSAIAAGLPFQLAYGLLAVNTLSCVAVFWRTVRARCQPHHLLTSALPSGGTALPPALLPRARRWLRWRGLWSSVRPDGALHGGRGRFSAVGSPLFHLALVCAAAGVVLEEQTGFSGTALVNEGHSFFGEPGEYLGLPEAQAPRAPQLSFHVRSIHPEYFGDELFFTELVAEVETPVGPSAERREVRLSDSTAVGEGLLTLVGFGYSLEYALRQAGGPTEEEGVATLLIFPPGRRDTLRLPGRPHSIFLELFPDFVLNARGAPASRGMALGDVRVGITVMRGRAVLAKRLVRLGDAVQFEGLEFSPVRLVPQGQFRVRRSAGLPAVGAASLLMLLGLALRLLWPRREVLLFGDGTGALAVQLEGEWPLQAEDAARAALAERRP